jgi:hypothetical protein
MDSGTPGFTAANVWCAQPNHGLRGNELWTHSNGANALSTATCKPVLPVGSYQVPGRGVHHGDDQRHGPTTGGRYYTAADAIDFRVASNC